MKAPETLGGMVALYTRLGFKVVFMDRAPADASLYGAGWGILVYEKGGAYWQAVPMPSRRTLVIARLG